jgi:hypothetical protein
MKSDAQYYLERYSEGYGVNSFWLLRSLFISFEEKTIKIRFAHIEPEMFFEFADGSEISFNHQRDKMFVAN